jgi:hypothetical protein
VGPARTGAISPVVDDAGIRFRASESIFARRANNRKVSTDTIVQWIHLLTSGVMCTCSMYRIRLNRICATDSAVSKEPAVTSAWLLFVAFMGGGCAGILLMALMRMAGDLPDQSNTCSRGWIGNDPIRLSEQERHATDFEGARENRDSIEGRRPYKRSARDRTSGGLRRQSPSSLA